MISWDYVVIPLQNTLNYGRGRTLKYALQPQLIIHIVSHSTLIINLLKTIKMGMYTELIFGAELKKDTPNEVIEALKYMLRETETKPTNFPLPDGRCEWLFCGGSYYFAVNEAVNKMWFDDISRSWHLSTRSNIKNYDQEIQTFLEWIKPYIDSGSGGRDMYAIVIYEEQDEPTVYYLHDAS